MAVNDARIPRWALLGPYLTPNPLRCVIACSCIVSPAGKPVRVVHRDGYGLQETIIAYSVAVETKESGPWAACFDLGRGRCLTARGCSSAETLIGGVLVSMRARGKKSNINNAKLKNELFKVPKRGFG